ncbi:major facilitator superfamily domain-containing protein [Phascolomyces articulosus]|uniref:Major facilitator superfamily domain-containing protein n=1 Tax=Phascolomyces articulosus TaxID=60185 RepID=A0AAD5K1Z5_9FUNG|nr:major facilitator superfamily domain-containing protein [Phascolomyces articulosus]
MKWPGIIQDYYQQNNEFGNNSTQGSIPLQLSFVGTLFMFFEHFMAPFSQILRSIWGTKIVLVIGTFLMVIGFIIASFASQIWHLYLAFSVLAGTGGAFLFAMTQTVVPEHFGQKRGGLALGCISSGGSIGSLVFPFIVTPLNDQLGVHWTFRISGAICLTLGLVACILMKDCVQHVTISPVRNRLREMIKFNVFQNSNFIIWCLGAVMQCSSAFTPMLFIPSYATYIGLSDFQGSSLVSIGSGTAVFGRIFSGYLADRIGAINTNIIYLCIGAISNLLIWTFAYSYGVLAAFMAIYGFIYGSYYALGSPITASILNKEQVSSGVVIVLLFNGIAVLGPSVASAVESTGVASKPFFTYKMFTGITYLVATLIMILLKLRLSNNKLFAKM